MTMTRKLGVGALLLGLAAPFAGSPYLPVGASLDADRLARLIAEGRDHVTAVELAGWIRERKPHLRVVDVRSPEDFAAYAIPTAENIPIESIPRAVFAKEDIVVLYSEGGAHAGQAWVLLRAMGHANVFFISGGLVDWDAEVMAPVLAADAGEAQRQAFERAADLSRYFGGEPRLGPAHDGLAPETAERPRPVRRRGC
jgi:rhodanese-related sulfurtransferase